MKVIVLAAGKLEHNQVFVSDIECALLIPYNGRPLISAIFLELQEMGAKETYFAIPETAIRTRLILERYQKVSTMTVHIIEIASTMDANQISTLRSVFQGIEISKDESVLIMYGDGIYRFESKSLSEQDRDLVFIANKPNFSQRYSSVIVNEESEISRFVGKDEKSQDGLSLNIETGAYRFVSIVAVRKILTDVQKLIHIVDIFNHCKTRPKAELVQEWLDFGHWDLINSQRNMNTPRSFNRIELSDDGQRIIKYSSDPDKNMSEFNFLHRVPSRVAHYFPRVFGSKKSHYELEYWPLKSLSEFFCYWGLPESVWRQVACSVMSAAKEFKSITLPIRDFNEFNAIKLKTRISNYSEDLHSIFNEPSIQINGKRYVLQEDYLVNLPDLLKTLDENSTGSFVHGDLCFSNILYSPDSGVLKFIDPRGYSNSEQDLTNIEYDLAKLLHSFHGLYDFIVQDFFEVQMIAKNEYSLKIYSTSQSSHVSEIFLQEIVSAFPSVNLRNLQLIEASLFFSMIPLHSDSYERSLALLLRGIQIVDEISSPLTL